MLRDKFSLFGVGKKELNCVNILNLAQVARVWKPGRSIRLDRNGAVQFQNDDLNLGVSCRTLTVTGRPKNDLLKGFSLHS